MRATALLDAVLVPFAMLFLISFPLALYAVGSLRFIFGAYPGSGSLSATHFSSARALRRRIPPNHFRGLSWSGPLATCSLLCR